MTKNQIEYLKLRETQRSNVAQEHLTAHRDANTYEIALGNLNESVRSHKANEDLGNRQLRETVRSNMERERTNWAILDETNRHNVAVEGETNRHNLATESQARDELTERKRSNLANEQLQQLSLSYRGQEIAVRQKELDESIRSNKARELETNRSNLAREIETQRSNLAQEKERYRSNVASEQETARSHRATENLRSREIGLGYSQLAETSRSNRAREQEQYRSNTARELETNRSNLIYEDLQRTRNRQENAHNLRSDANTAQANIIRQKQLAETTRANQASEKLKDQQQGLELLTSVGKAAALIAMKG